MLGRGWLDELSFERFLLTHLGSVTPAQASGVLGELCIPMGRLDGPHTAYVAEMGGGG